MAKLDDLPPELKELILHSAPDTPTLRSLVHSSPLFLHTYHRQRERIFAKVLSNELTPAILHGALFVGRASDIVRGSSWIDDVNQLFADFDKGISESFSYDIQPRELFYVSKFLMHLHDTSTEFFHSILSQCSLPDKGGWLPVPTHAELRRIHRSILPRGNPPTQRNLESLFSRFELWELEEIVCMKNFFCRRHVTVREEYFIERHRQLIRPEHYYRNPGYNWDNVVRMKNKIAEEYSRISKDLMSFRSQHLRSVVKKDEECRKYCFLVKPADYRHPSDTLSSILGSFFGCLSDPSSYRDVRETHMEAQYKSDKEGPNAAWAWYIKQLDSMTSKWDSARIGRGLLKSWGYVFWDCPRLESLGFKFDDVPELLEPHGLKAFKIPLLSNPPKLGL